MLYEVQWDASHSACKLSMFLRDYSKQYGKDSKCPRVLENIVTTLTDHNIFNFEWSFNGKETCDFYYPSKAEPMVALLMKDPIFENSDFKIFIDKSEMEYVGLEVVHFVMAFEHQISAIKEGMKVADLIERRYN